VNIIEIKNINFRLTESESKLSYCQKNIEDAGSRLKFCQEETNVLRNSIDSLKVTIADTNSQLNTCSKQSSSLQIEISNFGSNLNVCNANLQDSQRKVTENEKNIVNLNIEITSLKGRKRQCETDISALRCESNKFFDIRRNDADRVRRAIVHLANLYPTTQPAIQNFITTNNVRCEL